MMRTAISENFLSEYPYQSASPSWANHYLWPKVTALLRGHAAPESRVFELGCGSGATANMLSSLGYAVTAVDASASGIELARAAYSEPVFAQRSAYDALAEEYGTFSAVVSLEVIEHCYAPRKFVDTVFSLLNPGGVAVISTPYHGYLKNLALALAGKFDDHWSPLWDGGHIKFWSERTLRALLHERGFDEVFFARVGRIPPLAKSVIAVARRPQVVSVNAVPTRKILHSAAPGG